VAIASVHRRHRSWNRTAVETDKGVPACDNAVVQVHGHATALCDSVELAMNVFLSR
jgi:hypothetical protein